MYYKEDECINPFETLGPRRDAFGNLVKEKKDEDVSNSALSQLLNNDSIVTETDKIKQDENIVEEKPLIIDFAGLASDIQFNQENREAILKQKMGTAPIAKKFSSANMEIGEAPKKTTRKKKTEKDTDGEEVNEREQVDFYEKRFSKPLNRVQSIIDELDMKKDKMEAEAEEMREISKKARNGAILEYLGKTESNIIDTIKTKLSAIKEEVNINTKISELELKKAKDKADVSGASNNDAIMSKIYANIAGGNSPTQQFQGATQQFQGNMSMNDIYDNLISDDGYFNPASYASDDSRVDEMISNRYNHLVDSGRIVETEADKNLKYANRSVTMCVYKEDGGPNWRFAAIDNESNQELFDYEKPTVLGNRMNFDVTKMIAYDNVNRYPLILMPYVDEYEEKRMVSSYGGNGQYVYDVN